MLTDILQKVSGNFADGVSTVLRGQENRRRGVALMQGNLVQNERTENRGISALVTKNGVQGFASVAAYTEEDAAAVLQSATKNALFLHEHAPADKPMPPRGESGLILPRHQIVDAKQKEIIEACQKVDQYIEKNCPKLISRTVTYTEDSQDKIIYSSDAASGHVATPRCYIYTFLTAQTPSGAPVELFETFGGLGSFEDNFATLDWIYPRIDELYRHLLNKADGVYAEAGLKTVILGGMMGGMLAHEAVGHTVEADLVLGGSVAGPYLNKQVASPLVSLVDFAHTAFGEVAPLPVYLDDEGIIATDDILIKDGILVGYMNNRESARQLGMTPTGNARGWEFKDEPLIRMRNTCILPGESTLEEMIAATEDGYYLIQSGNGQADLTGEFMFGVSLGYEIKNGKLGKALLDTTVSGIAFEMLKTVDMVSNHIDWSSSGFCGKKQPMAVGMGGPHMRCQITIGGR